MEISIDGKQYRRTEEPSTGCIWGGTWEFKYKSKWHRVLNYGIKINLNKAALQEVTKGRMNHEKKYRR